MKRAVSMLLCGVLAISCLAGCGNANATADKTESKQENETENEESEVTMTEVKIWHDGDEGIMNTIAETVNGTLAADGVEVVFEKKSGLTEQLQLYGNDAANGPDMYLYAHDSLGSFAEMGILADINEIIGAEGLAEMLPMTVAAGNYKDTQYLMPVYFETLLFMYNKAKWDSEIPTTTDELYDYMVANTDVAANDYVLVNQHSTAYNVAPFINAFGGYIIDKDANPGLDLQETKDAITYNQKFAALEADGDYNTVTALFNEGNAAAIIGGPWLVSGIKEAGIDLGIKSLAEFTLPNGNGLAPYSGVQSIGVLKHALEGKKDAVAKALLAIAQPEVGIALAKQSNCAPANAKAYDDADVTANEMIMAMKKTAETAEPMPNVPQMSVMWGPSEELLAAVNKSGEDVDTAAARCQQAALTAIEDMQ